ncbi:MAG TPA: DUF5335 family protein [Terriglobales bacterium]|nr:DUF5335 family protein [Terriglobales bacterium]
MSDERNQEELRHKEADCKDVSQSGEPRGGEGRRDEVGRSGVYPMSGPHPPGDAPIRTEAAWGQGERGAAGYEDHGSSELTYEGGQVLGGYSGGEDASAVAGSGPQHQSREIPRGEWLSFLDGFSRQHERWLVSMEVEGRGSVTGVEAENLQLEGITPEHSEGHDRISIALGRSPDDHLTHFVSDPKRLLFLEGGSGGHGGLEIEAADGSRTVIRFRGPSRPETLNDVAA